jgi:hypothetical protein
MLKETCCCPGRIGVALALAAAGEGQYYSIAAVVEVIGEDI